MRTFVQLYSRHAPLESGKGVLGRLAAWTLAGDPFIANSSYTTRFELSFPEDVGWESIFFRGAYERGTTAAVVRLLEKDDVFFDIGANIGWYTALASKLARSGECHSFEPLPSIFQKLRKNCELNDLRNRLVLNQLAVGEADREIELHTFKGKPHGFSSISDLSRLDSALTKAKMITLDTYLAVHKVERLDLVKIDVEGAELSVLQGGRTALDLDPPPSWILEMNEFTAHHFGYSPPDLLAFLRRSGEYSFFRIVSGWGSLHEMRTIRAFQDGDNVLCIPAARRESLRTLREQCLNRGGFADPLNGTRDSEL